MFAKKFAVIAKKWGVSKLMQNGITFDASVS